MRNRGSSNAAPPRGTWSERPLRGSTPTSCTQTGARRSPESVTPRDEEEQGASGRAPKRKGRCGVRSAVNGAGPSMKLPVGLFRVRLRASWGR
ncbi:hypothetical protein NDU88_000583 [Pleurodeles waltl]|uniref:Uncharacterized protein n=1 Tax=Pleurodeles waltl TaxID=8319 RepID=A0AAV7NBR6_PLEWA|nr:hypothetical protein NDU88_000583 [Pleurodeles waltl]